MEPITTGLAIATAIGAVGQGIASWLGYNEQEEKNKIEAENRRKEAAWRGLQADQVERQAAREEQLMREQQYQTEGSLIAVQGARGIGVGASLTMIEDMAHSLTMELIDLRQSSSLKARLLREGAEMDLANADRLENQGYGWAKGLAIGGSILQAGASTYDMWGKPVSNWLGGTGGGQKTVALSGASRQAERHGQY